MMRPSSRVENPNGATIYLSKQDNPRTIRDIEIVLRRNFKLKVLFTIFVYYSEFIFDSILNF